MNITVYNNFSKRRNSTKQPTGGTVKTVTLKEATSIEHPTFVLESNDFTINYVQAFGAYYFVDDVKSVRNNVIEISCSKDVGASYKTDIGNYTAFVERCSATQNSLLPDPEVALLNGEVLLTDATTSVSSVFVSGGYYVLSVLNDLGSGEGFTTYYATDISNLEALAAYVNTDWGSSATDVLDWLKATFLKTADSIIDCKWVPFSLNSILSVSTMENIKIGVDTVTGVQGRRFTGIGIISGTFTVSIPHYYSDFRKGAPYTYGKLFIPGYGIVDFNPLDFGGDLIQVSFDCDAVTGDVCCYLSDASGKKISTFTYNVAVSCPVGKIAADVGGTATGILSTAASAIGLFATGGAAAVASGVRTAASAINTVATAVGPTASVHGTKGGRAIIENGLNLICTTISKYTTDPQDLRATHGRMIMADAQISSIPGYIKCSNASVPISGEAADKEAVNALLNNGFYYE